MQSKTCQYCDTVNEETENGLPDTCFACGMFFELKDQLKEWMYTLAIEIRCLKKWRLGKRVDCEVELQAMMHEINQVLEKELKKDGWRKPEDFGLEPAEEEEDDDLS